ncbi:transposase [Chryseobacterium soli]|uniref:transposase n=1 Tax=Chryseobacterium soli TaxID=445961 RepID=UPI002954A740|nr:transposase [Chryseobacterium soli]MDV7695490.1 transposase [Chryseobacterium soli]
MSIDFKNIHIGELIHQCVHESSVDIDRICSFMKQGEDEIHKMYTAESMETAVLLRWSKLLEYDFFRIYTQHLILYAPPSSAGYNMVTDNKNSQLPKFRKNIYTKEMIYFILETIEKGEKTTLQVIKEYGIPKSTLFRWIKKYSR